MSTIAFDGVCFGDGPTTGVGRSFANALAAYAQTQRADCLLLLPDGARADAIAGVRQVEAPRGTWRRHRQLPPLLRSLDADLLHSSVASVPLRASCPTIATAHDLPWLHPKLHEPQRVLQQFAVRRFLRGATRIITPSSQTTDDVRFLLGTRCPPTATIPHGTDIAAPPTQQGTAARTGPLLVLGDQRARKNRKRLERAHGLARKQCPDLPGLAFVGPPDRFIGETEKNLMLGTCRALVHVSLFEGFGMPVLEALAAGAPTLCSDLSPHREIAASHALFVDPRSPASIVRGLVRIHRDEALRWQLADGGHQRAGSMTAQQTAQRWADLHRDVLGGTPS